MRTDIEITVRGIISRVSRVDVSTLGRDDDLVEHLGVDSLQGLQILAGVEKRFDIMLPDDELITFRTIGRIEEAVQRLLAASESVAKSVKHEGHEAHEEITGRPF